MGTRKNDKHQLLTQTCTNQIISWLVRSLSTFGARTSHGQTWIHKTHHDLNLGKATTFPLIVYYVPGHRTNIQMSFCPGTPKWESRNSKSWDSYDFGGHIILCANLRLGWDLKKSCSPRREFSNNMSHATYT
jgi:hypothetical protein